ncbi:carotenoid 1,2-hydratase [Roseomonas sp. PWR1]|uniref:Carotenoid 1,2-hydratase n=1 Tax=Roseomonas nitratireducens TaxID=2820810 RepID=A0ABS4APS7_9PROT|nr:carotenoid 1,2-hydratase [Neoroseomonas nitratireducens]MBP0463366.1 carotenoid 1,2-hydratase [Neoroseomonas nitratireducens]
MSEDGAHGITIIAFIGTVFSPWFAWAHRRGEVDPAEHCCMNVALYGSPKRWAMTDRRATALKRDADNLAIGPSTLHWDGTALTIGIEERTAPVPSRLAGRVRVIPDAVSTRGFVLDGAGRHRWQPIAARARVEVTMTHPALRWSGPAYFDTNTGTAPLEEDFAEWDWCRAPMRDETVVLYNATRRDNSHQSLALRVKRDGAVEDMEPPPPARMAPTLWRLPRPTRADGGKVEAVRTLVDAPFYSRSEIRTHLLGQESTAVHEYLNLRRFRSPILYSMLPFRVPRTLR